MFYYSVSDVNEGNNGCMDEHKKCLRWSVKRWFTNYCSGRKSGSTASGYFGGTTLGEACKKSCQLCDGNVYTIHIKCKLDKVILPLIAIGNQCYTF